MIFKYIFHCVPFLTLSGQFYTLQLRANMSMDLPAKAKSLVHLTFFDEPDKSVEAGHWEYWYNIQANPNQRAFDIGARNMCCLYCVCKLF